MFATPIQRAPSTKVTRDYLALTSALYARGERMVRQADGVEQWTRTYAARRKDRGELFMLDINKRSWYFILNPETRESADKLFVWVGTQLERAGKLNTGARLELIEEGKQYV